MDKGLNCLPTNDRSHAASGKYARAVDMYAATGMPLCDIAKQCGVSPRALSVYIARNHRPLLLARYGLESDSCDLNSLKVKPRRGQSRTTHLKYKEAIEACDDPAYIELNISQVARLFELSPAGLANQLHAYYPRVIPMRERLRQRLGIADNVHRGPKPQTGQIYARAIEMYRDTDMTIADVACQCGVSESGLTQHLRFYHKDILDSRARRREAARKAAGERQPGQPAANGAKYGPRAGSVSLYAKALELYNGTAMTVDRIVDAAGVSPEGFRSYVSRWHRDDRLRRHNAVTSGGGTAGKRSLISTAAKYAPAIACLKANPGSIAEMAARFNLNADVFREYLKAHYPELTESRGMVRLDNGRLVKRSAYEKYKDAVHEYATTDEDLKSIARRHGIVYNSLSGYVRRNCTDLLHGRVISAKG